MNLSASLTPFSRSVVLEAMKIAHRRQLRLAGTATQVEHQPQGSSVLWDNSPLAGLICAAWDQPPSRIAHLLGVQPPSSAQQGGKAGKALKMAQATLEELPGSRQRLQAWAGRVFNMAWTQADILQAMEEIEPRIADAFFDERQTAAIAVGGYAHVLDLLEGRFGEAAPALLLDLTGGLAGPDAALIDDLAAGTAPDQLRQRYGHRAEQEFELSLPRFSESLPAFSPPPPEPSAWQPQAAAQRRRQAVERVHAGMGLLQRGAARKAIEVLQNALVAHAQARDTLALTLAAARRWSLAAAAEGRKDGRLKETGELFLLELEEIKQMMTGEWHSREQVQPLVLARSAEQNGSASPPSPAALGVAGSVVQARARPLSAPAAIAALPAGDIALCTEINPAWAALYLRAGGVLSARGDLLSYAARVGRAGGVATLVGRVEALESASDTKIKLNPAQNGVDYPV